MPKTLRYEEDYQYLADETKRSDFWDPIKFIPLTTSKKTYLSLGGELRERYENTRNPSFDLFGNSHDDVLLHRLLLSADLHIGDEFRTFVQLGSYQESGRDKPVPTTDTDDLDLHQGFLEVTLPVSDKASGGLRVGRQEMIFGSGRLVTIREGPNIRRSFDGARALYRSEDIDVDTFLVRTVELNEGIFDDQSDRNETFWGVYSVVPLADATGPHLDIYYLGLNRNPSFYAAGTDDEHRHTVGSRLWGIYEDFDYNVELMYQFGEFGRSDIRAWGASLDIGLTFPDLPFQPRIGLKADAESGDDNLKDNHLKTFNPLFPNNAYFSEAALGAPMNDIDVHPNVTLKLSDGLVLNLGWDVFWREQTEDAVYNANERPLPGTEGGGDSYVGNLVTIHAQWRPDRHLEFNADYTHFDAGDAIKNAGGKDVDFFMVSAAYRF
jgi:hypothetical protein